MAAVSENLFSQALSELAAVVQRRKVSWRLVSHEGGAALTLAATRAIEIPGGFAIALKLSREEVEMLKSACDEVLGERDA